MKVPKGRAEVNATYGKPYMFLQEKMSQEWHDANIVSFSPPFPMYTAWEPYVQVRSISIHRLVKPMLESALREVYASARLIIKHKYGFDHSTAWFDEMTMQLLKALNLDKYGGGFNYRLKRGGTSLSTHSYGIAIDLDPAHNAMGSTKYAMPLWVVKIFEKRGFVWGGRWRGRSKDAMHFQLATGI
jgi:hypothetical protein